MQLYTPPRLVTTFDTAVVTAKHRRYEAPDVEERHEPPLPEKDDDEDHHESDCVVVASGVRSQQLSCAFNLVSDDAVGHFDAEQQRRLWRRIRRTGGQAGFVGRTNTFKTHDSKEYII